MTIWRRAGMGLLALMLGGTALSAQNADFYFEQKEYQKAMQAYIQMLQVRSVDGNRMIRYSPEIMTRIGISAFHMNMTDGAIKVFRYVNQKTPNYSPATLYLGLCYEKQGKFREANQIYTQYTGLDVKDPAWQAMKARVYYLQRLQYKKDARNMAARGPGASSDYPTQRMLVLDLYYAGTDVRGTVLSKGIAALIIDDLMQLGGLQVVPREKIYELIFAMGWQGKDLKNIDNIEKLQRMLGVGTVIQGELQSLDRNQLKVSQRTLTFTGVRQVKESAFEGNLSNLIVLEKKIVIGILKDLGIKPSSSQIEKLKKPATMNTNALLNYAYALHALDQGQYVSALSYFRTAADLDPSFTLAKDMLITPDIFDAMQSGDWAVMQLKINQSVFTQKGRRGGAEGFDAWVSLSPLDRLQEMGYYLDAGFIPGSDSRNGFEDLDPSMFDDWFPDITDGLPDPPNPPDIHYPENPWILPDPPAPPHHP